MTRYKRKITDKQGKVIGARKATFRSKDVVIETPLGERLLKNGVQLHVKKVKVKTPKKKVKLLKQTEITPEIIMNGIQSPAGFMGRMTIQSDKHETTKAIIRPGGNRLAYLKVFKGHGKARVIRRELGVLGVKQVKDFKGKTLVKNELLDAKFHDLPLADLSHLSASQQRQVFTELQRLPLEKIGLFRAFGKNKPDQEGLNRKRQEIVNDVMEKITRQHAN